MIPTSLWLLCLAAMGVRGQDDTETEETQTDTLSEFSFTNSFSTITTNIPTSAFTGSEFTYLTVSGQTTVRTANSTDSSNATATSTSINTQVTVSSTSVSLTVIGGVTSMMNGTGTTQTGTCTTSSAPLPSNTLPCNGFPEFCNRRYSNITYIAAHNAAFAVQNNAASNQEIPIRGQLDDGIRMLQGQVHWVNDTLYNCHTSCAQLNAGTFQSQLEVVRDWLADNPYDVVTMLIGNYDQPDVINFVAPFENAGLMPYVYEPAYVPQFRDQWPTLGEMILRNERLVVFMDYAADQGEVPWILDQFTHMWETPFSPVDQSFPCTIDRPPEANETELRENFMYLANHNLNTAVDLSSIGLGSEGDAILIPNTAEIDLTNGRENQYGRLGAMSLNCTADWNRPPNFLLVDYYNRGSPEPGSVFHVAAEANGVTYTQECCGLGRSVAPVARASMVALAGAIFFGALVLW